MTEIDASLIATEDMVATDPAISARIAEVADRWRAYDWELIPATPMAPNMNLALDEVLTRRVGKGERPPTLRFWGWASKAVILGRFQSVKNEVNADVAAEHGIEVVRRISGGGAMFVEPEGAITYSIYAPESLIKGLSFPESYAFFDAWVIHALRKLGLEAWYAPLNDITASGGKIGGAAQARRWNAVLHHVTMAYAMNGELMSQVLRIGKEKLSDKGITSAAKRVGPLSQQTSLPRETLIAHLTDVFRDEHGLKDGSLHPDEIVEAEELIASRFSTKEWVYFLP
ncbi:biotin/lipoate A/B protein ligase family protein [soil metagenome]